MFVARAFGCLYRPVPMDPAINAVSDIPPPIATSVVRGSEQGESHGGLFVVDPAEPARHPVLTWDTMRRTES